MWVEFCWRVTCERRLTFCCCEAGCTGGELRKGAANSSGVEEKGAARLDWLVLWRGLMRKKMRAWPLG